MAAGREATVKGKAIFSADGKYRYLLTRTWDEDKPIATVIMQNPSYADELKCDLSIMKLMNFLIDYGYGSLRVVNLFAYISTDPNVIKNSIEHVGAKNDKFVREAINGSDIIIIAWGSDILKYIGRKRELKRILINYKDKLKCFVDEENRMERHPSRLGNELELMDFSFIDL